MKLSVMTYNTWHGLDGKGWFRFGELEPRGRRHKRWEEQLLQIQAHSPDIVFLQEVNPVDQMTEYYASRLGYSYIYIGDNRGVKVQGIGLPTNLDAGLAILFRKEFKYLDHIDCHLSGESFKAFEGHLHFQLQEIRKALVLRLAVPGCGFMTFVNAHLHHGIELDAKLRSVIRSHFDLGQLKVEQMEALLEWAQKGDLRRQKEILTLLETLNLVSGDEPIVLGGDFNATPENTCLLPLWEQSYKDLWPELNPKAGPEESATWGNYKNQENLNFMRGFHIPMDFEGLSLPKEVEASLRDSIVDQVFSARRVDYLMLKNLEFSLPESQMQVFGDYAIRPDGPLGSDHLGLYLELQV